MTCRQTVEGGSAQLHPSARWQSWDPHLSELPAQGYTAVLRAHLDTDTGKPGPGQQRMLLEGCPPGEVCSSLELHTPTQRPKLDPFMHPRGKPEKSHSVSLQLFRWESCGKGLGVDPSEVSEGFYC